MFLNILSCCPKWPTVAILLLDKECDLLEEADSDGARVVGREDNLVRVGEVVKLLLLKLRLSFNFS